MSGFLACLCVLLMVLIGITLATFTFVACCYGAGIVFQAADAVWYMWLAVAVLATATVVFVCTLVIGGVTS